MSDDEDSDHARDHSHAPQSMENKMHTASSNFTARLTEEGVSAHQDQEPGAKKGNHNFEKAQDQAEAHRDALEAVRKHLVEMGVSLPSERFDPNNAEIWRFAYTMGLAAATTSKEK